MSEPVPPLYRCPTCRSTSENARNLAIFIDDRLTSLRRKSNVARLYDVVSDGNGSEPEQHRYYLEGIGSYDDSEESLFGQVGKIWYSTVETAFAWNIDKNIKDAYNWLASRYRDGDQIYLFGFSRGAYQVRALASMIHEIGLVKETHQEQTEKAYRYYNSLDPGDPETRRKAAEFKRAVCWPDAKVHFVGVWHTVSSLGLVKRDVHITSSASATNACHFRHALALDECRVKFMPEYFDELNAHRGDIQSPRSAVSDVKEVWFGGSHSDIGGITRPPREGIFESDFHAGNVPLFWMRQAAAANGLFFSSEEFTWCPEDVDFGRFGLDSMNSVPWKFLETMPIRHQVSFSGSGKHGWRWHMSRPPSILPTQQIHYSVSLCDVYMPSSTLGEDVDITTVPWRTSDGLWTTELDEGEITCLLKSLLSDRRRTLESLSNVWFLLDRRLSYEQSKTIPIQDWLGMAMCEESGFHKFALTIIHDVIANFATSDEQVKGARDALKTVLRSPDDPSFSRALHGLRFSAIWKPLRRRFVAQEEVIETLIFVLKQVDFSRSEYSFLLVMDTLRYLIEDDDQREYIINQLTARLDGAQLGRTMLSLTLEMKRPKHLVASLRMITALARFRPDLCGELLPRILKLAERETGPVGLAAVEILTTLDVPLTPNVQFSNVLGYLNKTLPPLDVEVGATSPGDTGDFPRILQVNGSDGIDEGVMHKLLRAIKSLNTHRRTLATLLLLKLCRYSIVREFYGTAILDIFLRQMESKETSLLAVYAMGTCLKYDLWSSDHFRRVAPLVLAMLSKGWLDNALGRVEGFDIFGELIASDNLRQRVINLGIVAILIKKLEGGNRHEVRTSLICLDILEREDSVELTPVVTESLRYLEHEDRKTQAKGVRILSALARTVVGERAIIPHIRKIVRMLPQRPGYSSSHSQSFAAVAVLFNLCRNEIIRDEVSTFREFDDWMNSRGD